MEQNIKKIGLIILKKVNQKPCFYEHSPLSTSIQLNRALGINTFRLSTGSQGFTLVETLIAISILLVSVVGPIGLIGDATHKIYFAKDEMIAINLAQEGVEAVRMVRDTNILSGTNPWDSGILPGNYVVDILSAAPLILCGGCDQVVYIGAAGTTYRQGGVFPTPTQFSRIVTITSVSPLYERKVVSTVTWKTGGDAGSVSISENLYKWTP